MSSSLRQAIYWKAPYPVKCWMASWNARRLDHVRYGRAYDAKCREIAGRDGWSRAQFEEFQRLALQRLLREVAPRCSHYRAVFREHGIDPEQVREVADLARLPILRKQTVRENPRGLLNEAFDERGLVVLHTSGTTGTSLTLFRDVCLNAAAFAYLDERWHRVADVRRRESRSISIGGHLVTEPNRSRAPFWVLNRRWNQMYMSSFHLAPQHLDAYVEAIRAFKADYIEGYPSSIYAVARHILDAGHAPIPLRACFTTAETLCDYQRAAFREAFRCPTYDQYGCGEMAVFAAECSAGAMHLSPEIGIVEVLDDDGRPVEAGATGHLVCTSLINTVQPFIRYRLGDMGSLRAGACACGSPLPILGHVEGREDAVLVTRDGRRIGRLDSVFKDTPGVAEAQIVQEDYDRFTVRVVPNSRYSEATERQVISNLVHRLGSGDIRVERVPAIERTRAGKFRAVVSRLGTHPASSGNNVGGAMHVG